MNVAVQLTLFDLEEIIERGRATFLEVGAALLEIRSRRLYRQTHATFEEYCRKRWDMGRHYANRLILAQQMEPIGTIENEYQARKLRALMSSASAEWTTPPPVVALVIETLGAIDLDPCSNDGEPAVPAAQHFREADDALTREWTGRVYMNPPYGRTIGDWITKLEAEYRLGHVTEAVALVPARVDTEWWRSTSARHVAFAQGRLVFSGYQSAAPFPSAALYLGARPAEFLSVFGRAGWATWVRVS